MAWSDTYMIDFESAVITGIEQGVLGAKKMVPAYPGKLAKRRIGRTLGVEIRSDLIAVIDYYGYMKKSSGFFKQLKQIREEQVGKQLKMVEASTVHFNSVRLEVIAKIAPNLVEGFGDFKKAVLDAREFNHNYKI